MSDIIRNLKYLDDKPDKIVKKIGKNGKVVGINLIHKEPISLEKRRILAKSGVSGKNFRDWNSEYREHILHQIIFSLISPFPPKISSLANKLGLELETVRRLIRTDEYQEIKNSLRKQLRDRWGANIDQVVIKKALQGSKYHAELFYKLQQELIDKVELTKKTDIPESESDRLKEISRMNKELGFDVRQLESFSNPSGMKFRKHISKKSKEKGNTGKFYSVGKM